MSLQTSLQMNFPIPFALDPNATVTTRRVKESVLNLLTTFDIKSPHRYHLKRTLKVFIQLL